MLGTHDVNWLRPIPLFPLPNCVLFPGAVLPLHIFEPRYLEMMESVAARSANERLLAMALLRNGWEPYYHTRHAPIHPVLCVGRVIQHERLDDGCFNLLLLGLRRATVMVETGEQLYRQALLSPVESGSGATDQDALRHRLRRAVLSVSRRTGVLSDGAIQGIFDSAPTTDMLVDVLAYHLVSAEQVIFKQSLLEEQRAEARAEKLLKHLREVAGPEAPCEKPEPWPPPIHSN